MKLLCRLRRAHVRPITGQTLIIFALISLVLMGALGLVLDAGYDLGMRRQMQNAADAAALAGVRALTVNTSSPGVLGTVQQVAGQNGVANPSDSSQLTCDVLDNSLNFYASCSNTPFVTGTAVSAVRVTVHETHPTFVMRVLGNSNSNSGATATAQVTVLTQIANSQAPFLVCGINTQVVGTDGKVTGQQNILQTTGGTYNYSSGQYPETAAGTGTNNLAPILSSAYAVDASQLSQLPNNSLGPRFLIHAPGGQGATAKNIAPCNTGSNNWKGYNGSVVGTIDLIDNQPKLQFAGSTAYNPYAVGPVNSTSCTTYVSPPSSQCNGTGDVAQAGSGTQTGPASGVPGPQGCPAGQDPNDCVLLVPIIDDSVLGNNGTNNYVAVRRIEAFYITENNNGSEHYGQLIKGYSPKVQGSPVYQIGYSGILIFRLVR